MNQEKNNNDRAIMKTNNNRAQGELMDEYSQRLFSLLFEITPKLNGFSYPNLNFQDKYSSLLSGHACYLKKDNSD